MSSGWNYSKSKTSDLPYIAIIFFCCIVAYWPVSFFVYSLKNDALNYFLPVRFQVSEAISNGYWPFWSPYFNLGYPLHGDMQSGVWNPIVQIFSLFGPYTLKTLQVETLLYVLLSGIGMFYLIKHFKIDKSICLLIAISYMLCGFNSDSAQFLNWISSAAFLPFVILFFYRAIFEKSFKACLACGLFLFIYFVSAYPVDFIILSYLMLGILICSIASQKDPLSLQSIGPLIKRMALIAVVFIILSAPSILSYLQFFPLSERGSGTSYKEAMVCPLHPLLLFSYLTPLGVWKAPNVAITDPLERNSYFGIITLLFFLYGFFSKTNLKWIRFCKWSLVISLIFSLGEIGIIRPISYYVLPLMNTFRSPANAKIFTIFFACIISAFALQEFFLNNNQKSLKTFLNVILGSLMLLLIWSITGTFTLFNLPNHVVSPNGFAYAIKQLLEDFTFSDLLLINISLQLPFIAVVYFYIRKKVSLKTVLYAGIINSVIHTSLFMPFTVVKKDRVSEIQNILDRETIKKYPLPNLNSSVYENSVDGEVLFDEIGTLNMYNKKIGRVNYRITPCNLNNQNSFWQGDTLFRNLVISNPIIYKADVITDKKEDIQYNTSNNRIALLEDNIGIQNITSDSSVTIIMTAFSPNSWDIEISSETAGFYNVVQNYYPNWKLYIDGKESKIFRSNISFIGFFVEKGNHKIGLRYEAPLIKFAFIISLSCMIITIVILLMNREHLINPPE